MWRGRPITAPKGAETRPTAERTREALFSMLTSRIGSFEGLRVADLFAGTGALGLEALSRGATHCTFVEQDKPAITALRKTLDDFGAAALADIRTQQVGTVAAVTRPYDILFLDPPYGTGGGGGALDRLARIGWVAPGAWVSVETGKAETFTVAGFTIDAERVHGKAKLTLLRMPAPAGA